MKKIVTTVIICTHNPHDKNFARVIGALKSQTLATSEWELLLIDNASTKPLATCVDLSWHPQGRHIREEELGLTPARLRGIKEAEGEILVFVDDDNVLDNTYLAMAVDIGSRFPFLGAWGGSTPAEYEIEPPLWLKGMAWRLGVRQIAKDTWSNDPEHWSSRPIGAGLCIRSSVGRSFLRDVDRDGSLRVLDRRGQDLFSDGDHELVARAKVSGLGWGTFKDLRLIHLMPAGRLSESYMSRLIEGQSASRAFLDCLESPGIAKAVSSSSALFLIARTALRKGLRAARFKTAELRGTRRGQMMAWQKAFHGSP